MIQSYRDGLGGVACGLGLVIFKNREEQTDACPPVSSGRCTQGSGSLEDNMSGAHMFYWRNQKGDLACV